MNRLACSVWTALFFVLCALGVPVGYAAERAIARYGPWVLSHADGIAAVVLTVCAVLLAVLAVAQKAKRNNPSW